MQRAKSLKIQLKGLSKLKHCWLKTWREKSSQNSWNNKLKVKYVSNICTFWHFRQKYKGADWDLHRRIRANCRREKWISLSRNAMSKWKAVVGFFRLSGFRRNEQNQYFPTEDCSSSKRQSVDGRIEPSILEVIFNIKDYQYYLRFQAFPRCGNHSTRRSGKKILKKNVFFSYGKITISKKTDNQKQKKFQFLTFTKIASKKSFINFPLSVLGKPKKNSKKIEKYWKSALFQLSRKRNKKYCRTYQKILIFIEKPYFFCFKKSKSTQVSENV